MPVSAAAERAAAVASLCVSPAVELRSLLAAQRSFVEFLLGWLAATGSAATPSDAEEAARLARISLARFDEEVASPLLAILAAAEAAAASGGEAAPREAAPSGAT